ncbi:MAG: TVP38/TMEM64 family protein, partial [Rhizobiales bacterium]|nr:TVP38/TMEM64 family protein [Hyphomicrobiales bacterium]
MQPVIATHPARRGRRAVALVLAILAAGLCAALYFGLDAAGLAALARRRAELAAFVAERPLLAAVAYVVSYAATTAVALPGAAALTVIGGFLFGARGGAALAVLGATAGGALLFLAASTLLGERLRRRAGPRLSALIAGFREDAASYLLALRLAPIFPFWLVNLAAAMVGVRFSTFLWTTALGVIPATFAFALGGAGLDAALQARQI